MPTAGTNPATRELIRRAAEYFFELIGQTLAYRVLLRSRSCLRLCVALSEGGFSSVGHFDPLPVRRGLSVVVVVPVPPLVRRGLRVTLWRVLPGLLTAKRRHIEVAPGGPHR